MASVREVARSSGVSIATVSRVLNDRSEGVAPETRARVMRAVRDLNYRAPASRRGRSSAESVATKTLAVLVTDMAPHPLTNPGNGYFAGIFDGLLEAAAVGGYATLVHVEKMWGEDGLAARRRFDGRCDGVIYVGGDGANETVAALAERGVPVVSVGATPTIPGVDSVDIANEEHAAYAGRALAASGHRRLAYFGPDWTTTSSTERHAGLCRGAAEGGLGERAVRAYTTSGTTINEPGGAPARVDARTLGGFTLMEDMLARAMEEHAPDAILAWNDAYARSAVEAARARGLALPHDLSIWSFDDPPYAATLEPALTTFRQPLSEIGTAAVRVLLDRIAHPGAPARHVRLDAELRVRASVRFSPSSLAPPDDREVPSQKTTP